MRWPWTREEPAKDDLRELRASVSDLQADVRRLNAEWVDMYDKLVRRDERLRRREERAAAVQEPLPLGKAALWARAQANGHRGSK
jgi:hypothetical protein